MRKYITLQVNYEKRLETARRLHKAEKENKVIDAMDVLYAGKSTDNEFNFDRKELNSFLNVD